MNAQKLAQVAPTGTGVTTLFSPTKNGKITSIVVANVETTAASYSLYVDGTTWDAGTALAFTIELNANSSAIWEIDMGYSTGDIWKCQSSVADDLTFTVFGEQ